MLRENFEDQRMHEIIGVNSPRDVTRKIDLLAEERIIDEVKREHVKAVIIAEEQGVVKLSKSPDYLILLDPLDGSNNYVSGIPYYSISIAFSRYSINARLNDLISGIVVDVPFRKYYHAFKGEGAYIGESKLTKYKPPGTPMVLGYLNGEAYLVFHKLEAERGTVKLRSLGSASLDLVHVARGGAEVFADLRAKLRSVDIAGGYVILREMGGTIYTGDGKSLNPTISNIRRIPSIIAFSDMQAEKKFWRLVELFKEMC